MAASCCARACASVFVSIYLLLLSASFVSANVRTTRPITTTSAPGGLFSEFDADPVNFPASPKMFIEQVMATSKDMVIRVFYSDTQQELISYNISYQLVAANEREQPLASTHRKLPNEFNLQNLLQETSYNVCVRASFTRGEFALYTMQIEKVRNCSIFSTIGEPLDTSRGGLTAFIGIVVYICGSVLISYAVYKLRNRYCRDACKCACLESLLARCSTVVHAKWILIRDYFGALRPRRQLPAIDGVAQQQSRNAVEAANTYIAVPQNEDASKRANCNKNHSSTDCLRADSCDPMSRSEVWADHPRKSQFLSQRSLNDLEASRQSRDSALRCKESVDTSRSEGKLHDPDSDVPDSPLRADLRIASRHNQNIVSCTNAKDDASGCDVHVPLRRISKRSRSPRDSGSAVCHNESCKKSNGSSHERRTARNNNAPKLVIQNATPGKDSGKTSRDTATPTATGHSPTRQSPNTGDPKAPLSRATESERTDVDEKTTREASRERLTKSSDRHECPQHGSIVLTINPDTVLISNKKRKRKERSEQELSPERLDERERFVRSFYEKLYARQRSGTKQLADEPVERDRSRSRRSTAPGSRKPPTPTDTQHRNREPNFTKVSYRKQRSMPVTGNTNAVPTLTADTNDMDSLRDNQPAVHQTSRTGGSRRKTTEWSKRAFEQPNSGPVEIENRHRKMRAPLDSLENDQTDDEVWILRASKV